ncbi:hypothetical protein AB0G04_24375 [Actinoplanes sp. NPDC023801]|uniref:hypothetical protein n=1 Tax=Actinoplanes sp. NPDC023801 TaxID=3154595 RepID=UPI0033C5FF8A
MNANPTRHRYFISFTSEGRRGREFRNAEIVVKDLISNIDQIRDLSDQLASQGYQNPVILSFSLFAEPAQRPTPSRAYS